MGNNVQYLWEGFEEWNTKTIYDTTKVQVRVKASGEEALSPYKITFLIITDSLNKFEVDVYLRIRED